MKSLYELTDEILALEAKIDLFENADSISEQELAAVDEWLSGVSEQHVAKLNGYASYIKMLEHEAQIAKDEKLAWEAKQRARTKRVELLKSRIKEHMEKLNRRSLKTELVEFRIVGNGGKLPVLIFDEGLLPADCLKSDPVPDKTVIFARMEAGQEVPGAKFGERGSRLEIK